MTAFLISFNDKSVALNAAESIAADVANFFQLALKPVTEAAQHRAAITEGKTPDRYGFSYEGQVRASELTRGEVLARLAATFAREANEGRSTVTLQAGLVGWGEHAALIVGGSGSGKTSLIAWMVERGFAYLADENVALTSTVGVVAGFPEPLSFEAEKIDHLGDLEAVRNAASVPAGKRLLVRPEKSWLAVVPKLPVGLILWVSYQPGAEFKFESVGAELAARRLAESTKYVTLPSDPGYRQLEKLAGAVPMLAVTFGKFEQIEGVLDFLTRAALEAGSAPAEFDRFLRSLPKPAPAAPPTKVFPIPAASNRTFTDRKLTIGMATYDDFDGVYFSIQSARLFHPSVDKHVEFVVIDNRPDGPCGGALKKLESWIPNYRYIPNTDTRGPAGSKNRVFQEAQGDFVMCMDCHVMIVPGAVEKLLNYISANPQTDDLLQGPLIYDDLKGLATHYDPVWRGGSFGTWGNNPAGKDLDAPPFDIPMQGMGLFVARRKTWLAFNPQFRGFGGEEGYIHQKYRQAGRRTLCLPFLRWLHRFPRPMGVPYPLKWADRIHNYLSGLLELGLPTDEMEAHFRELLGTKTADRLLSDARREIGAVIVAAA